MYFVIPLEIQCKKRHFIRKDLIRLNCPAGMGA
jgi:hypothetical protein